MSTEMHVAPYGMKTGQPVRSSSNVQEVSTNTRPQERKEEVPTHQPQSKEDSVESESLNKYVEHLKDVVPPSVKRELQFSLDEDSGRMVVKVVDMKSGETIRQVPSEDVLKLQQALEKQMGVLLNVNA